MLLLSAMAISESDSARIEALIAKLAEGDIEAMGPIYDMTRTPVYAYALSLLKNSSEAEDVLHDCYLRLYRASATYTPSGKPMAFIMTVTRNLCLDRLNELNRFSRIPEESWETLLRTDGLESNIETAQMLDALKDDERQIVLLHAVAGFRHRETAKLMGLPLSTVLSKYSRALKKLRTYCGKEP